MIINSLKETKEGFLINGNKAVKFNDETTAGRALRKYLKAGGLVELLSEDITFVREAGVKTLNRNIAQGLLKLTGDTTSEERETWAVKEAAARQMLAQPGYIDPLIEIEAGITGEEPEALAQKIVQRANTFKSYAAGVVGYRRKFTEMLQSATSKDEVAAILVELQGNIDALSNDTENT